MPKKSEGFCDIGNPIFTPLFVTHPNSKIGVTQTTAGYDETAELVNKSYAETGDIHQTMRETRLPFDVVWEMVGFKDEFDFLEIGED